MTSTGAKVRSGIKWLGLAQGVARGIQFLSTMALARLLSPEMFGLVAMANVSITVIATLRDVGLADAYVQREVSDAEELSLAGQTSFYLAFAANVLLFVVAFWGAPLVALFFRSVEVVPLLRVLVFGLILDAIGTGPAMVLRRQLDFRALGIGSIVASSVYSVVAVSLALAGHGLWSLVYGQLSSQCVRVLWLYTVSGWRPRLAFSSSIARQLFGFGKYLWAFGILSAVGGALDRMLVGRALGSATLGVYHMGSNLANLPSSQISQLVNRVTFPAYARMQGNPAQMLGAFRKALSHVAIVALPVAFGILAVAAELIGTVYGDKWSAAVPVVQILVFYGMTLSISSVSGPVFTATGRTHVLLYTSIVHHGVLFALLLLLSPYGVVGIAWAVVVPVVVSTVIAFVLAVRYLHTSFKVVLEPVLRSALAGLIMYGVVYAARYLLQSFDLWVPLQLGLLSGLGAVVYVVASLVVNRVEFGEFHTTVKQMLRPGG